MQTITTKKEKLCNAFREDSTIIKLQSTISAMWLRGSAVDNNKSNSNKNEVEFIFDSKKTERKKMELIVAARQRK